MAELFGRRDGCAHGRGGSMHLLDAERGYYGGWGIVAGQLPVATGLALALVRQGRPQAVALRARRRRREHGRLARVAEPRRALGAPRRLPRGQQRVRHGHVGRARLRRARAVPPRQRVPHARRARGRQRPGGRHRAPTACSRAPASERRAGGARGDDLPLPRPLGRRRRPRLPHQGRDRRAPGPRPAGLRTRRCCAKRASPTSELDAIDREADERVPAAVEFALRRAGAGRSRARRAACTPPAAPSSSRACGRAARSARWR